MVICLCEVFPMVSILLMSLSLPLYMVKAYVKIILTNIRAVGRVVLIQGFKKSFEWGQITIVKLKVIMEVKGKFMNQKLMVLEKENESFLSLLLSHTITPIINIDNIETMIHDVIIASSYTQWRLISVIPGAASQYEKKPNAMAPIRIYRKDLKILKFIF